MKAIVNVRLVLEDQILDNQALIYDHRIEAIAPLDAVSAYKPLEVVDGKGLYLSPGLIDMHIHGIAGADFMDGTVEALGTMAATVASQGVTAFVPTTMTASAATTERAVSTVRQWRLRPGAGAEVLGVHLEGPFISSMYKGAQNPGHIRSPKFSEIEPYLDVVKVITLAPEMPGALDFIAEVKRNSTAVLSIGHSSASCEQALMAYEAGARHITHCFNAMSPFHHRQPGVVGAALGWPFSTEIICDNVHVNPVFYQGFVNIKGLDKVIPITDSIRAGGLPDGCYTLGGQQVAVQEGICRLSDGTLAGSTLKLNESLRNLREHTDLTIPQLVSLASRNPASVLGVEAERGTLAVGKLADFFLHDDAFNVAATTGRGKSIYMNLQKGR